MTSTSVFRVGVATILGVAAVSAAASVGLTAQPRESWELVVRVLAKGRPVTNARVDCRPAGIYDTDKDGTAVCRFPAPTDLERLRVSFTAHAPGFAVEAWVGDIPAGSSVHTIGLVPEVPVTGRVFDPEGKPFAGASVTLRMFDPTRSLYARDADPPDHQLLNTKTDEAGRFTIRGARPGRMYRLAVTPFGPLAHTERFVEGGAPPIDVRLPARGNLEVNFTATPDLLPVVRELLSDSTLEWRDENGGPWRRYFPQSRSSNALADRVYVVFWDLPAGVVRIVTPYRGPVAGDLSDAIAVVANGSSRANTRNLASMHLVAAREVRLRVLDDENQPVTDARLVVTEGRGQRFVPLDADGWATMAVHPGRDATVIVRRPGYVEATAVIAAGVQSLPPIILRRVR
jgi:protocatechuate 3,4-dioxygenase beta subunit